MSRTTWSPASRKRRKRVLKAARGYRGARSKQIRTVYDAVDRANNFAFIGRKQKKRQYRRLWVTRINIACRLRGINYSRFIYGLKKSNIDLNRKVLADLAILDTVAFDQLVDTAKKAIA
ncbi:MAG: 50S ribosomal protein L20 [Lentisphaeria bacterium]|nr:50S ribosomal protein L20 [Lentisphaeria bacterium]